MATNGWVIRDERRLTKRDGTKGAHVSWWFGPHRGWGATYGPVEDAKVWPTRRAAESAWRDFYGNLRNGTKAQRLADALNEKHGWQSVA